MKIQIRRSLFETNSSSIHSLTMCSDTDYEKWKSGEYVFDYYNDKLIPLTNKIKKEIEENKIEDDDYDDYDDKQYLTFNDFFESEFIKYELFSKTFTTENGEVVHAFGYYGNDY